MPAGLPVLGLITPIVNPPVLLYHKLDSGAVAKPNFIAGFDIAAHLHPPNAAIVDNPTGEDVFAIPPDLYIAVVVFLCVVCCRFNHRVVSVFLPSSTPVRKCNITHYTTIPRTHSITFPYFFCRVVFLTHNTLYYRARFCNRMRNCKCVIECVYAYQRVDVFGWLVGWLTAQTRSAHTMCRARLMVLGRLLLLLWW